MGDGHQQLAINSIHQAITLLPISEMRRRKMIIEYDENEVAFKRDAQTWYRLPTTPPGFATVAVDSGSRRKVCE